MDILQEPIFEMKFINVEYVFYKIYLFVRKIFGGGSFSNDNSSNNFDSNSLDTGGGAGGADPSMLGNIIKTLLFILILFLLTLIIYTIVRMFEIRKKEHEHLHEEIKEYREKRRMEEERKTGLGNIKNPRWRTILEHINSNNQNDWKLAIIEADSVLDSLLNDLGFKGESTGDKLKSVDKEKFKTLNSVWEAHNMRNKIAHEADFELLHNEAKRIIGIYEEAFRTYNYI